MSDVSNLVETLHDAKHALATCYEVAQSPADGTSYQDKVIDQIDAALSTFTAETSADTPAHTVEREKGYREGIEAAAQRLEKTAATYAQSAMRGVRAKALTVEACIEALRLLSSERPAPQTTPVHDGRPATCRDRLQEEGKPYPRSACHGCGWKVLSGRKDCPFKAQRAGPSPLVERPDTEGEQNS